MGDKRKGTCYSSGEETIYKKTRKRLCGQVLAKQCVSKSTIKALQGKNDKKKNVSCMYGILEDKIKQQKDYVGFGNQAVIREENINSFAKYSIFNAVEFTIK